jgi:hypothetical protein
MSELLTDYARIHLEELGFNPDGTKVGCADGRTAPGIRVCHVAATGVW